MVLKMYDAVNKQKSSIDNKPPITMSISTNKKPKNKKDKFLQ